MSDALIVLIAVAFVAFFAYRLRHRRYYRLVSKLPVIDGLPLIGVTHKFALAEPKDFVQILLGMVREDMRIGCVWFGSKLAVIANTPEQFQVLFTSPHCVNKPRVIFDGFFADSSSFCVDNPHHERRLKLMSHSFTSLMLNRNNEHINGAVKGFMRRMDEKCERGTFDVYHHIAACALRSTLSGQFEYYDESHDYEVVEGFDSVKPFMVRRMARPWFCIKSLYNMSSFKKEVEKARAPVMRLIQDILEVNKHHRVPLEGRCAPVIRQLLDTKQNLSDGEIIEEIYIDLYGAHETSALTLSAALILLATHKDVMRKVLDEIDATPREDDFTISNEETQRGFPYIDLVLKETLRLFPPVGVTFRETSAEIELEGYTIPPDTVVALTLFPVYRSAAIWGADAASFRPERFESGETQKIHSFAYAPFSFGKRMCIGYRYAMIFMKIFLVNFLRSYEVETDLRYEDIDIQVTPATTFMQGYPIRIRKRK